MPWEMLSGPDLGGGFLFQLTLEPQGERARLIYHAQEGGIDASGPPRGSPVPLGFARTTTACEIGGRDCYHRSFELAADGVPKARLAYNRLRFVTAPMLEQQYAGAEVPVPAAVEEIRARLTAAFADRPADWFFAGRTAAWLQGAPNPPREIDLGTTPDGLVRVATALSDYLIEPLAETTWRGVGAVLGARAYVGTLRAGVRVQWALRMGSPAPNGSDLAAGPGAVTTRDVDRGGHAVRVSRPEYAVVGAAVRGDRAEETAAAGVVRAVGVDLPLLERLLSESALAPPVRARIAAEITSPARRASG